VITQELVNYIREELSYGLQIEEIRTQLENKGWHEEDITQAFSIAAATNISSAPSSSPSFFSKILKEFSLLFNSSFNIYRQNMKQFLKIQSLYLVVFIILFILSVLTYVVIYIMKPSDMSSLFLFSVSFRLFIQFLNSICFLILLFPHLVLLHAIDDTNHMFRLKDYIKNSRNRFLRYVGIQFAIYGMVILTVVLIFISCFLVSSVLSPVFPLANLLIIIGVICAGITGIFIYAWYLFSSFIFVSEKTGVIQALKKSKSYVQHHVFFVILHMFFLGITLTVFGIIPIVGIFLDIFIAVPIANIYLYKLYKNLKMLTSS